MVESHFQVVNYRRFGLVVQTDPPSQASVFDYLGMKLKLHHQNIFFSFQADTDWMLLLKERS